MYSLKAETREKREKQEGFISAILYGSHIKKNILLEVETEVPIELKGKAGAVELGGTLIQSLRVLNVSALPADLPHKIEIDVSSLKTFEDYIDVASVDLGKKVKILTNKEEVIATVVESEAEEIEEEKQEDKTITTNEA